VSELVFDCLDVSADRFAAGPTLNFRLRVAETTLTPVHAIALRCQIRIEPHTRRYSAEEAQQLNDLFGEPERWADTLKPIQFAQVSAMVPSFTGSAEVDVAVPCSYDLEVASGRYFNALDEGDVPLLLLFSGTVFTRGAAGFSVEQVPWHKEARYRLPVAQWRVMMDRFFPDSGWLRLRRETIRDLAEYKSRHALATWEQTVAALLAQAKDPQP
jgi:hypothetical protein